MQTDAVIITPFDSQHQTIVRNLILEGLAEHWGVLDPAFNHDLLDIAQSYNDSTFLLAWQDDKLVGTGALIPECEGVARIVRMSVDKAHRRQGIGKVILKHLLEHARKQGLQKIVLETTARWEDAIAFYKHAGFQPLEIHDGDLHFELFL